MARLKLELILGAVEQIFPPVQISSHENVITCLGIVPQDELHRIISRTDIAEFHQLAEQGDHSVQHLERVSISAPAIVKSTVQLHQDVASHCALDVCTV